MAYSARILADSVSPVGCRLTTFLVSYPRFVHSELMTHREFSRNSASSRAIPISKMLEAVRTDPVLPVWWGANQRGMQAQTELNAYEKEAAIARWLCARDLAVQQAEDLARIGVHKQLVNRLVEPWMWIPVIVSATQWDNFWGLRCHPDAQPEIKRIAEMMHALYDSATPEELVPGQWHLPMTVPEDYIDSTFHPSVLSKVSAGRCARVSYLTHEGERNPRADIDLCDRLISSGHMSPLEHPAQALAAPERHGNFVGFLQLRKTIPGEAVFSGVSP